MQLGLGKTSGDETEPQLHKVSTTHKVVTLQKIKYKIILFRIVVEATARTMRTAVHRQIQGRGAGMV